MAAPPIFEFATATRIIFGPGCQIQAGSLAAEMGWRAFVACGLDLERVQPLLANLAAAGVLPTVWMVPGEPSVELVRRGLDEIRRAECDLVIGFGGGSAIDAGKALAALATNPGEIVDYLEIIGRGQTLSVAPLPFIAIPTTAGTGAEVTRNAVLSSPEHRVKVSLRSPLMLPRLALVDPELTYSLPPQVTATTGLDALTQLIEPFLSNRANPLTDAICQAGMGLAARSLRQAYLHSLDPQTGELQARQDMSLAALFGGIALANARLGVVHGFAGPIGGMFNAPHGAICARLLPAAFEVNRRALLARQPDSPLLPRFETTARILTGNPQANAADGSAWLRQLVIDLQIMPLAFYGVKHEHYPVLVEKAARASSTQGNPIQLTQDELSEVLELSN